MTEREKVEVHDLVGRHFEVGLDAEGEGRLGELLRSGPVARSEYRAAMGMHAELLQYFQVAGDRSEPRRLGDSPTYPRRRRWLVAGLAACVAFLGLWVLLLPRLSHEPAAVVVTASGAVWGNGRPVADGQTLSAGPLELRTGSTSVRLPNGVVVTLHAPALVHLGEPSRVRVERGRISAVVPEQAIGFCILTPTADVVDLGTEFGVDVGADGASEVHVFQGKVVAQWRSGDQAVPLLTNEAGRLEPSSGDIVSIPVDAERFDRVPRPASPPPTPATADPLPAGSRVVVLGGRVIDRETILLLTAQSLATHGGPTAPKLWNLGHSMKVQYSQEAFDRYAGSFQPTHAVLAFGPDLASQRTPPSADEFAYHIGGWLDALAARQITPILMIGFPTRPGDTSSRSALDGYERVLREAARVRNIRLADATPRFAQIPEPWTAPDDFVPTFAGSRVLAATLLDGLGYGQLPVPTRLRLSPIPGLIPEWRTRTKPSGQRRTAAEIAGLRPDDSWQSLALPLDDKLTRRLAEPSHAITRQYQARGLAFPLHFDRDRDVELLGTVRSERDREAILSVGGTLFRVWLNGKLVYQRPDWDGVHAGKERIPIPLRAGENRLFAECHDSFFLNLTPDSDWDLVSVARLRATETTTAP